MLFSAFTPLGLYALVDEVPLAERLYNTQVAGLGDQYTLGEDSHVDGVIFANAIEQAFATQAQQRAQAQRYAGEVDYLLPKREAEYGVVPTAGATMLGRRTVLAIRKRRPAAWTFAEIHSALSDLLGSDFVAFRPCPDGEAVVWPPNAGDNPMNLVLPNVDRKIVRLLDGFSGLGSSVALEYKMVNTPQSALSQSDANLLKVGDRLALDVGHSSIGETVVVTAVATTPLTFTAFFTKPHDVGTLGFTQPFPWWTNTLRHHLVVLTAAAAQNTEKRRLVDDFMRRAVRSTSRWSIVAADAGSTLQFEIGQPSLGFTTVDPLPL